VPPAQREVPEVYQEPQVSKVLTAVSQDLAVRQVLAARRVLLVLEQPVLVEALDHTDQQDTQGCQVPLEPPVYLVAQDLSVSPVSMELLVGHPDLPVLGVPLDQMAVLQVFLVAEEILVQLVGLVILELLDTWALPVLLEASEQQG